MDILKIEHVSKHYSGHTALDDVSLSIPQGCIYGLLGPNGAGKTTLIRIINHITAPDSGVVYFDNHVLNANDVNQIGYLPEERGLYKKMKVGEQAVFFARLKGLSKQEATKQLKEWFEKFDISEWWNKKVEELSKGMAQKIQFIITILHKPKLLIFDEPFSGFDPINANMLKDEILKLRDNGATIIFSTHNMESVEAICDNITLINKSHNILSGSVEDIKRQYSNGRYQIIYSGDEALLNNKLQTLCTALSNETLDEGLKRITLKLSDNVKLKEIIGITNDIVDITRLNEVIPSMNDIFIHTVEEYNKTLKQ